MEITDKEANEQIERYLHKKKNPYDDYQTACEHLSHRRHVTSDIQIEVHSRSPLSLNVIQDIESVLMTVLGHQEKPPTRTERFINFLKTLLNGTSKANNKNKES